MNSGSKLPHAILGTVASWILTAFSWLNTHSGQIAGLFAVVASIATIWAATETALWRRKQRRGK